MPNVSGFPPQAADVVSLGASRTLTAADSGKVFTVDAVDLVATLPAATPATKGCVFKFVIKTISATTGFSVAPVAADQIAGKGITAADNKAIINTAATDAVGDLLEVTCDGAAGYLITGMLGTWARAA